MVWIDAQMSPAIAVWITANFPVACLAVREVGLRDAEDREIFLEAKTIGNRDDERQRFCCFANGTRRAAEDNLDNVRQYIER